MKLVQCPISGPIILEPKVFGDDRGFFLESWNADSFRAAGLDMHFVQDNHSRSNRGVVRGLHYQSPEAQGKLVRVVTGRVWDVVVDLRRSSISFGSWFGVELSGDNKRMLWVPEGFAHGFLTLEDGTDLLYKCTAPYDPDQEHILAWNDPQVSVDWPLNDLEPLLSDKDRLGRALADAQVFA
jgi:dTDP-4-dehydrorhamnose 3,5-epimerase